MMARTKNALGRLPEKSVTSADYERLAAFRLALRRFLEFSSSAASDAGLTPQQHQALLSIKGKPGDVPMSIGELAEHSCVRHHTAVELVDRLEKMDLLVREPDVEDARKVRLRLTAKAERILVDLSAAHLDELHRIGPNLAALLNELAAKHD
ncbi:MarR family winged helix-turn-helix transcriptional regulator [Niveibacterium sp. COAC-50]|uniref:MarR family winged helix-turn-helix transcriptional regulator n=1 Tax=Niveibacterium sp. COAC-50 TaxID=2729384 RepID=UPI001C12E0DE|nr:MarR family transcriptional regulator [Niveibacterium sp. COAC-50]